MISLSRLLVGLSVISGPFAIPIAEETPDFVLSHGNYTELVRRQDYTQNYQTGGDVEFFASTNGYQVTFSDADDFVVGRGWTTGAAR